MRRRRTDWPRLLVWASVLLACVGIWVAVVAVAFAADKPADVPWCSGTTGGYCNPLASDPARAIPPDQPPAEKLRRQLVKERKVHRAEVRSLRATIRRGPDFEVSLRLAAIAYGQSASHLKACALSEGYGVSRRRDRHNYVTNREGSGATSSFQFMRGTFLSTPYAGLDWHRQDVQAHAAAWMWANGRRGEWAGSGC